ncbi:RNA-directed DNA polymerase, eukaryota, reverse transcriptase zinc-binding domain protein [Tanacetum coccineum]
MSFRRQNDKHQVRVPIKLGDFEFGTKNVKNKKNNKSKMVSDEIKSTNDLETEREDNVGSMNGSQIGSDEVLVNENRGIDVNSDVIGDAKMNNLEQVIDEPVNNGKENNMNTKNERVKNSYANMTKNSIMDNKLTLIPTEINNEGYRMSNQELNYNIYRMWGKYGLRSIIPNGNGVYLFKFRSNDGIQSVIENRPWMVNGKPMLGFARVSIEVKANKGLPDNIEIVYKGKEGVLTGKKNVTIAYDWPSPICSCCKVFGDCDQNCRSRPKTIEELEEQLKAEAKRKDNNDFAQGTNVVYQPKVKEKGINDDNNKDCNLNNDGSKSKEVEKGSPSNKNGWKVQDDIIDSIRKSVNKFFVLVEEDEESNNDSLNEFMKEEQDVYE